MVCEPVLAQSPEDKRRIEEEKRHDLRTSEFYLPEAEPVVAEFDESDPNAYFQQLLTKDVTVMADAYRTLAILLGVHEQYPDPGAQYDYLLEQGIITENIAKKEDHDEPLRKGVAAYMYAKAIDIKGGIILHIFGTTQRYAFKELVYQNIMYPGNIHDVMTGQELILTLTQAADYLAQKQKGSP